jgi:hypothetical protein
VIRALSFEMLSTPMRRINERDLLKAESGRDEWRSLPLRSD